MLYVVKMGWKEMADTSRIDEVLSHALKEVSHITIDSLTAFMDLCSRTKEHMEVSTLGMPGSFPIYPNT